MRNTSRYIAVIISLIIIGGVVYFFSDILAYVLIAWVLSLLGAPIMRFFKNNLRIGKFSLGNTACAVLTLITFVLFFSALIWSIVPKVVSQASNLAEVDYATLVEGLEEPINDWNNWFIEKGLMEGDIVQTAEKEIIDTTTVEEIVTEENTEKPPIVISLDSLLVASGDSLANTSIVLNIELNQSDDKIEDEDDSSVIPIQHTDTPLEKLQKRIFSFFNPSQITDLFSFVIGFFGNLLIAILSIFFIAFFFLKEDGLFSNFFITLVPEQYDGKTVNAVQEITRLLTRYFGGVFIQISIITIFVTLALTFLGIENALLIGFFAALINVIPYIGPIIGAAFGVFIVISSNVDLAFYNETMPMIFKLLGVFACMQMIDNFILQPIIFSNSIQAHPLEVFIIILVGAKLGGVLGMVLAIPSYTILRVIAKEFLSQFGIVQRFTNGIKEP